MPATKVTVLHDLEQPLDALPVQAHPETSGQPLTTWRLEYKHAAVGMPITTEAVRIFCNGKPIDGLVIAWGIDFEANEPVSVRLRLDAWGHVELQPQERPYLLPHRVLIDGQELGGVIECRSFIVDNRRAIELTLIPSAVEIVQVA